MAKLVGDPAVCDHSVSVCVHLHVNLVLFCIITPTCCFHVRFVALHSLVPCFVVVDNGCLVWQCSICRISKATSYVAAVHYTTAVPLQRTIGYATLNL